MAELEIKGKKYDQAVTAIFELCVERGYFAAERDDNAILMTASDNDGVKNESMTAEIKKCFETLFDKTKMTGAVISDVDNGKWQKDADKYGINGQKYELIMRYLELGGELDPSQYESITIRELYSAITKLDKNSDSKDKTVD